MTELETVLERDFLEDHEFIESQIGLIIEYAKVIRPTNKIDVVKDDPDDNKIIECAITAGAKHIITQDKHLLKLKEVYGIKILKPEEFLKVFY